MAAGRTREGVAVEVWALALLGLSVLRAVRGAVLRRFQHRLEAVGGRPGSIRKGWLVREREHLVLVAGWSRWRVSVGPPVPRQARRTVWHVESAEGGDTDGRLARTIRGSGPVYRDERGRAVVVGTRKPAPAVDELRRQQGTRAVRWSSVRPALLGALTIGAPLAWLLADPVSGLVVGRQIPFLSDAVGLTAVAVVAFDVAVSAVWWVRSPRTLAPVLVPERWALGPWAREDLEALDVVAVLRLAARAEGRSSMELEGFDAGVRAARAGAARSWPVPAVVLAIAAAIGAALSTQPAWRWPFAGAAALLVVYAVVASRGRRARIEAVRRMAATTWVTVSEPSQEQGEENELWLLEGDRTPWVVAIAQPLPPDAMVEVHGPLEQGSPVQVRWEGEWVDVVGPLRQTNLEDVRRARTATVRALRTAWPEEPG